MAKPQLYPDAQFKNTPLPTLPPQNHWTQFAEACRGNGKTSAGFEYSGPLTETVLLGGVTTRYPRTTLEWNAVTNAGQVSVTVPTTVGRNFFRLTSRSAFNNYEV